MSESGVSKDSIVYGFVKDGKYIGTIANGELTLESPIHTHSYPGVLNDKNIKDAITRGDIILHSPTKSCLNNIQNSSVDISLGRNYYRNSNKLRVLNPWVKEHVKSYWGEPCVAEVYDGKLKYHFSNTTINVYFSYIRNFFWFLMNCLKNFYKSEDFGLKIGDEYILLYPGESILGHTEEFIGGLKNITTMMKARSSLGRNNITICRDAGWGDIGYVNRWTLEITNNGNSIVILPVGQRVGQIIFFYTGESDTRYAGKYQSGYDIDKIVANWKPNDMIPKL